MSDLSWPIRLRLKLLMPFSCKWNAWVRDITAWLERKLIIKKEGR